MIFDHEMERHEQMVERERRMLQRIHVRYSYELNLEDYEVAGQEVRDIMKGHARGLSSTSVEVEDS